MARVHHRVGVAAEPAAVFAALTEPSRLAGWWATHATGEAEVGGELDLEFVDLTHLVFEVTDLEPSVRLGLRCVDGPEIWIGSTLEFALEETPQQVYVELTHAKPEADDASFLYFNTKWPLFLVSLKDYLETGTGRPFPNDVRINHDL